MRPKAHNIYHMNGVLRYPTEICKSFFEHFYPHSLCYIYVCIIYTLENHFLKAALTFSTMGIDELFICYFGSFLFLVSLQYLK